MSHYDNLDHLNEVADNFTASTVVVLLTLAAVLGTAVAVTAYWFNI